MSAKDNNAQRLALAVALVLAITIAAPGPAAEPAATAPSTPVKGYAPINDLQMYYEIHGSPGGKPPLVLLHGGGSTIEHSFGATLPELAKTRQVVAFEQQGHGRTADVDRPFSFEQSADDTAALLDYLKIGQADFFGYSNGGTIALQIALRHPQKARRLIVMSGMIGRDGFQPVLWESLKQATPDNMPTELREAYLRVAPHSDQLPTFVRKCATRMLEFKDWPPEDVKRVQAPTLIVIGDDDIRPEHAVRMFRQLPQAQLAVLPGTNHMQIVKRADLLLPMIGQFLDAPPGTLLGKKESP